MEEKRSRPRWIRGKAFRSFSPNRKEPFTAGGLRHFGRFCRQKTEEIQHGGSTVVALTFRAFLAASASDRLSKLTNPTGWGDKKTEQRKETWFKAEYWVGTSVCLTQTCFLSSSRSLSGVYRTGRRSGGRAELPVQFLCPNRERVRRREWRRRRVQGLGNRRVTCEGKNDNGKVGKDMTTVGRIRFSVEYATAQAAIFERDAPAGVKLFRVIC